MATNLPVHHVVDSDWRAQKEYILKSLETLGTKVDGLTDSVQEGFAELRTDVALLKQAQSAHLSQDELEAIITGAMAKKKDSQTLTRDDIRRIAEESVKAKNGANDKSNGVDAWAPWRYVVLGAILLGGNRLLDVLLK